jgi:hypothetical protein
MLHRLLLGLLFLAICGFISGCGPAIEDQIHTAKRVKPDYKPGPGKADTARGW